MSCFMIVKHRKGAALEAHVREPPNYIAKLILLLTLLLGAHFLEFREHGFGFVAPFQIGRRERHYFSMSQEIKAMISTVAPSIKASSLFWLSCRLTR